MFPCLGGEQYWPLTASVGFFRAPADKVTKAIVPWGRGSTWARAEHDSLDAALEAHAPFGRVRSKFVLPSGGGSWTTVLDTGYPRADVAFNLADRAYWDVRCELVATTWKPGSPYRRASAIFVHEGLGPGRRLFRSAPRDQRLVQTSDQESRWEFDTSGEPRPFEEPAHYEKRRKAERLPRDLLARYAAAVGVAVDDPHWWDGPVTVVVESNRPSPPVDAPTEPVWHTTEELRNLCGYPLDEVPDDLVRFKSAR